MEPLICGECDMKMQSSLPEIQPCVSPQVFYGSRREPRCGFQGMPAEIAGAEFAGSHALKLSARAALGENPLQGAAVHVQAPRGFGHIVAAQFIDALDMLPAHAVGGHRIFRRLGLAARRGQ